MDNYVINGENLQDLLDYIEDQQDANELPSDFSTQPEFIENKETLSVALAAIALTGLAGVVSTVLIEFFKKQLAKKSQNEITITRKNERGEEIKVTLKNLSIDNVESEVKRFFTN
jgi:hypothetical protein